jgi:hypothetical protein
MFLLTAILMLRISSYFMISDSVEITQLYKFGIRCGLTFIAGILYLRYRNSTAGFTDKNWMPYNRLWRLPSFRNRLAVMEFRSWSLGIAISNGYRNIRIRFLLHAARVCIRSKRKERANACFAVILDFLHRCIIRCGIIFLSGSILPAHARRGSIPTRRIHHQSE